MKREALGEVATIERIGVQPDDLDHDAWYLGLEHIERGGRIIGRDTVAGASVASTKFSFSAEHVLFGKLRPNLGKVARPEFEGVCSTDILPIRPGSRLDRSYLAHYLATPEMVKFAAARATGANLPRLNPRVLQGFPVPVPKLDDQRRIAAILDHADAIRTKRRQILAHLDDLTQSIFHDMFREAPERPLGEVCRFYSGGTPSKKDASLWSGDVPWFSAKDLKAPRLFDSIDHIADRVTMETSLRLLPQETVVVVVRGMILAHTLPVSLLDVPATINQDLKALVPTGATRPTFLAAAVRSRAAWLLARTSASAHGTKRVDTKILANTPIPDVAKGDELEFEARARHIEDLRHGVERALAADDELFASLQSRAFRGEL